jgi:hypothetical protein
MKKNVKTGVRKKYLNKSYDERIEILREEILVLEKLKEIHEYFKLVRWSRNSYIVEMRKIFATKLFFENNLSYSEIGRVLCKDHSTIIHLLTINSSIKVEKEVFENYKDWMNSNVYPKSYYTSVPNEFADNGHTSELNYRLVKLYIKDEN